MTLTRCAQSVGPVITLSPAQLERVKALSTQAYPYLARPVRLELNRQLLESRYAWEVEDWIERMQATLKWYVSPETRPRRGVLRRIKLNVGTEPN